MGSYMKILLNRIEFYINTLFPVLSLKYNWTKKHGSQILAALFHSLQIKKPSTTECKVYHLNRKTLPPQKARRLVSLLAYIANNPQDFNFIINMVRYLGFNRACNLIL